MRKSVSSFETSVFRKSTFTGLGMSFFSHCCNRFKLNGISTLLLRAFKLSSTRNFLVEELNFLRNFFHENGYPKRLIESKIRRFFEKMNSPSNPVTDSETELIYFSLPFFGHQSEKIKFEIFMSLTKFYTRISFRFILVNPLKIESFFNHKDRIPLS